MSKMENSVKITGIIVVGVIVLAILGMNMVFEASPTEETIQAMGISQITVAPDLVSIYFNVETNASTAKEAKDLNSEIVDEVIDSLIKEGFQRDEIETINFNVYENFDWIYDKYSSRSVPKGYKATHTIRVKFSIDDSNKIGEAIDAGIDSGAMLSYINFELSQSLENQYKAEALKLASQDAKIKAESIAEGLDAKLGEVISVSNSDFGYSPWMAYDNRGSGGVMELDSAKVETSVQPGNQEVSAQVSVVYKLK
ncbi:MAG: SIMPL domain-containing protein [Candidatus Pacearchaeota archaeon]